MSKIVKYTDLEHARTAIADYVIETPLFQSRRLNDWLGHEIYFKAENLQRIGAFKARGGCYAVRSLLAHESVVERVYARSLGNHAQAVAWAARLFDIAATIYMPKTVSAVKLQATKDYGADVVLYDHMDEVMVAEQAVNKKPGHFWISPFNDKAVIAGQGTATIEAIEQMPDLPDAMFAPCGGGGLLSGMWVAARELAPKAQVIGVEPETANDAWRSIQAGKITPLDTPSNSIADGVRTYEIGDITFEYLKQMDDFILVSEQRIIYWTQWLQHLLKLHIETASAMSMDAVYQWLQQQDTPKKVLVMLSGGNIDAAMMRRIWAEDQLQTIPRL
ncbi:MAG: pyridoxal-phosphate dependent enzyme [Proteobacteria bacterium]|nr:MAG: pyridoxal-phosphate dependent enzyme [Pseudomonadota bacterium]